MSGVVVSPCPDLRHSAITNMCQAGIDPLTIMQISGHKTMVCFTRDNSFWEADLKAAVCKSNTYLTLARIIHEGFYCNHRYAATTSLTAGGLAAQSVNILFQVCLPHGSARPSRVASRRFRHEPS